MFSYSDRIYYMQINRKRKSPFGQCFARITVMRKLSLLLLLVAAPSVGQDAAWDHCGGPVLEARRQALWAVSASTFSPAGLPDILQAASSANMREFKQTLGPLSAEEQRLSAYIKENPPFLAFRLNASRLRQSLGNGEVRALWESRRRGDKIPSKLEPVLEEPLFSGRNCIYLSAGRALGEPRHGEFAVIFGYDTLSDSSWFTRNSTWAYTLWKTKTWPDQSKPVSDADRLAFSFSVISKEDAVEYLALALIDELRHREDKQRRTLAEKLLAATSREIFWETVGDENLLEAEVKIDRVLTLEKALKILAPKEKLQEALSWPEAARFKDKIVSF